MPRSDFAAERRFELVVGGKARVKTGSAGASPAKACAARSILKKFWQQDGSRFALIAGEGARAPSICARPSNRIHKRLRLSQLRGKGKSRDKLPSFNCHRQAVDSLPLFPPGCLCP